MIKCPCDKRRRGWEFINEWALWRGAKVCPLSCGLISQRAHTSPHSPHQPAQWQPFTKPSRAASREETVISQIRRERERERGIGDEVLDETWRTHLMSEEWGKDFVVTHGSPDQPAIVAHSDNSNKRNPGSSGWFTFHKESTQSDWPQTNLSCESRLQHLTLAPHQPAVAVKKLLESGSFLICFSKTDAE